MDVREMLNILDSLYAAGKLKEAEERLNGWLANAVHEENRGAALTLYNELEGLYRTTGRTGKAAEISEEALRLIIEMGLENTVPHGTTLLNGATANRAAGNLDKALSMYQEAARIFNAQGQQNSYQMASLYHNISHIYQEQGQHERALESLGQALHLVSAMENSGAETATTRVCMALSLMALGRMEEAREAIAESMNYYESPAGANDGHYGSALSAAGEFHWRQGDYEKAISCLERALEVTGNRFGENDACRVIRKNLEQIRQTQADRGMGAGREG